MLHSVHKAVEVCFIDLLKLKEIFNHFFFKRKSTLVFPTWYMNFMWHSVICKRYEYFYWVCRNDLERKSDNQNLSFYLTLLIQLGWGFSPSCDALLRVSKQTHSSKTILCFSHSEFAHVQTTGLAPSPEM